MNLLPKIAATAAFIFLNFLFSSSLHAQLIINKDVLSTHSGATEEQNHFLPETLLTDSILWGNNPGEGDFDGGLNGWTIVNDENACPGFDLWRWSPDGTATNGAFSAGGGISTAPTAANGAMAFDSDFYDNNGDENNLGAGDCPAMHIGELISPTIDLASLTGPEIQGVSLRFHQATRQFTSLYYVSYSNDDGNTWNDILINEDFNVNSPHENEFVKVFLPGADLNSSTFKVKFRYEANYYYWIIDDVQLVEAESFNLAIDEIAYAIAPNTITPLSQVEPFSHLADVFNLGASEQENVNLNVTIREDATNDIVFSDDNPLGTMPANSALAGQPFPGYYTPDALNPTTYNATYLISSDNPDADPSDNVRTYSFMTSDTIFAKDQGPAFGVRPADGNWDDFEPHSWAYGNYYRIVNGDDWAASSVTFMIGNAADLTNRLIVVYLYHWEDLNMDGNMDVPERVRVGFAVYEIQGTEGVFDPITLPLSEFATGLPGPITLESNGDYVVMVEYETFDQVNFEMTAGEIDYGAMVARSLIDEAPRYGSLIGIGAALSDIPFQTNAFNNLVPVVRLNITPILLSVRGESANVLCHGDCNGSIDLEVDGGTPDFTFAWTGPDGFTADTEDLSGLCPGTYEVVITDSQEEMVMASFVVEEPDLLALDSDIMDATCPQICDGLIMIAPAGGVTPFSFAWNEGSTSEDLTGLCAGMYELTITDANGCTLVESFLIEEPLEMLPSFELSASSSCNFPCQDSIDLTVVNGVAPLSFEWYDAFGNMIANTEDLVDICPGAYTVNITDANGCIVTANTEIMNTSFPVATANITNTNCFGICDGSIDLNINGGEQPYSFEWSNGLPSQEDQTDLCAESYQVSITDNAGCMNVITLNVEEPAALMNTISTVDLICFGACDGSAEIITTGGTAPYNVEGLLDDLCAGTYNVTVTDANGCTITSDFVIEEPIMISVIIDEINDETESMMNGSVEITIADGIPPYSYIWRNEAGEIVSTEEDPSGLPMGTYEVFVTDSNGCTVSSTDIVIDNLVSVAQPELNESVEIFPNPTSGLLQLKFELPESADIELEIYDMTGRLMQTQILNGISSQTQSINIGAFSDGVYTLKIKIDDVFILRKLLKYQW